MMTAKKLTDNETKALFDRLPDNRVGAADLKYLNEVLSAGFGNTARTNIEARFETAFAKKFGIGYAISHNSGTGTMHSCLIAAGIGPGDEVIVPTHTMASTAFVVLQCYAVPVFVDIDPKTFTMDPEDVKSKITPYTKAIITVSLYGLSPDMDPIMTLAKKHNLIVIEDNAQCFLGYYKNKLVGTIGNAASFSFQGSKHMTTAGDGGMVITDNEEYATRIRSAGVLGYANVSAKPGATSIPRDIRQDWSFKRHLSMGYNYRLPVVCSALGLGQLGRLDDLVLARQTIAALYGDIIKSCKWIVPQYVPEGYINTYFAYTCRLDEESVDFDWRKFRKKFIELGGDGLYGCWSPVHLEPAFQNMKFYGTRKEQAPHFHPLYKGKVHSYQKGDCPVIEKIQPTLMQLKTGYTQWEKALGQAEALDKTINFFNSGRR